MKESHRAWIICIGAFFAVFCTAGLVVSSFPVYLPYIRQAYGYSNTQTTTLITIRTVVSLFGLLLIDRYHGKLGLRLGISLAVLSASFGMFVYASVVSYFGHCLASVLCGAANGLGSGVAASLLINSWFREKRAFAFGIVSASTGLASVIAPIIIVPLIEQVSLKFAFCIEGMFIGLCALVSFVLIRNKGETTKQVEKGVEEKAFHKKHLLEMELPRNMVAILAIGIALSGFVMHGESAALPSLYEEQFGGTQMSFLTALFGFALMAGKIVYGRIVDKMGAYKANYIMFGLLLTGIVGICITDMYLAAAILSVIMGLGSPISNVTLSVYVGDFSSQESYAKNVKWLNIAMTIAGLIASTVVGALADLFGSYAPTLLVVGMMALLTCCLIQTVYYKNARSRKTGWRNFSE